MPRPHSRFLRCLLQLGSGQRPRNIPVLRRGREPTARFWGDVCSRPQDSWPLLFLDIQLLCDLGVVVVGMGVHIRAGPPSSPQQVTGQACRDPAPAAGGGPQLRPQVTRALSDLVEPGPAAGEGDQPICRPRGPGCVSCRLLVGTLPATAPAQPSAPWPQTSLLPLATAQPPSRSVTQS